MVIYCESANQERSGAPLASTSGMCRDILDRRPARERLVDAVGVERQVADQLAV